MCLCFLPGEVVKKRMFIVHYVYIPIQCISSTLLMNPGLQKQSKLPGVFKQVSFSEQTFCNLEITDELHSFMSAQMTRVLNIESGNERSFVVLPVQS